MAAPLNPENQADAAVVSAEAAIIRTASEGRPFTGGLYLGRHVNNDVYAVVPPAEALATLVAAGASDLHGYGYSGLDDGGVMFRMDEPFKDSLRGGLSWAEQVIPLLTQPRVKEIALLFPAAMSLYEPVELDQGGRHRMDLLGWYRQLVDLGWHVDVIHPDQVVAGSLRDYSHLVVPTDSLYGVQDTGALEAAVQAWVSGGGTLLHGPNCQLVHSAFGVTEAAEEFDCFSWNHQDLIPHGWSTVSYASGQPCASYLQSGRAAIATLEVGAGQVHSFGFQYGYAYSRMSMPIVPPRYGRREMHPVVLLSVTPVEAVIGRPSSPVRQHKGVEIARFGSAVVVVNHRSSPVDLGGSAVRQRIDVVSSGTLSLPGHSATYLDLGVTSAS